MNYESSSVLITGASQGIGRSIALTFATTTNRPILLLARNKSNLEETKKLCDNLGASETQIIVCDAVDESQTSKIEIPSDLPPPGIIINNAGSFLFKPVSQTTNEEFHKQVDINLFTTVNVTNRFLPEMLKMDRALIINICSVGALTGLAESGAYSAAKHAVLGYTRSLREELQATNVGISAINLGQTHSTSWDESSMSPERLINPTDVAKLLVTMSQMTPRTLVEEITIQPQHGRVPPM